MREEIEKHRPLVLALVAEMVRDRAMHADAVQEGMIKVWEVLRDRPAATRAYVRRAVRNRIIDVATRQTFTGHTGRRGKLADPLRRPHRSLDEMTASGWEPTSR